jgi:hypothetical protein
MNIGERRHLLRECGWTYCCANTARAGDENSFASVDAHIFYCLLWRSLSVIINGSLVYVDGRDSNKRPPMNTIGSQDPAAFS